MCHSKEICVSGIKRENMISRITHGVFLAVGLSLYFLGDLFKGPCFVSLGDYFNISG